MHQIMTVVMRDMLNSYRCIKYNRSCMIDMLSTVITNANASKYNHSCDDRYVK